MKSYVDGVEVNGKSIITSLKVIQKVCEDNVTDCTMCPFYINDTKSCGITDLTPDNWKIAKYSKFQALE